MNQNPKVSIITVCFNAQRTISQAIESALSQTYSNIEYIIIDGLSTDNTLSIVNRYKDRISSIMSEKDNGIYDAMNKGINLSTGDLLYFLNADDRLYNSKTIEDFVSHFINNPKVGIVYGKAVYVDIPDKLSLTVKKDDFEYKHRMDFFLKQVIPQQCLMSSKWAYHQIGVFNSNYMVCADYDWFLRAMSAKIKIQYINQYVAYCSFQGLSYQKRYQVIHEKIQTVFRNASILEFLIYFFYVSFKKIKHIFLEEIVTRLNQKSAKGTFEK